MTDNLTGDTTGSGDALGRLEASGLPVTHLTTEQQLVLSELTTEELDLLLEIKARLDEVEPDLQGHTELAGGALF